MSEFQHSIIERMDLGCTLPGPWAHSARAADGTRRFSGDILEALDTFKDGPRDITEGDALHCDNVARSASHFSSQRRSRLAMFGYAADKSSWFVLLPLAVLVLTTLSLSWRLFSCSTARR